MRIECWPDQRERVFYQCKNPKCLHCGLWKDVRYKTCPECGQRSLVKSDSETAFWANKIRRQNNA
jgi:DNA-directed RNA polymerase subunit RPC12/RpoP